MNSFGYQSTIKIVENSLFFLKYGRKPTVYAPACQTFALGKKANLQSYGNLTSDQNRPLIISEIKCNCNIEPIAEVVK